MKKLFFTSGVIVALSIFSSCTSGSSSNEDSARIADSIATASEQAKLDSIHQDSVLQIAAEEIYGKALTIEAGKKNQRYLPESSEAKITWACVVTNHTAITLTPEDYEISFVRTYEGQNSMGDFVDKSQTKTMEGPKLEKEASADVLLEATGLDIKNPSVKLKLTKEEFIERYKKEAK